MRCEKDFKVKPSGGGGIVLQEELEKQMRAIMNNKPTKKPKVQFLDC